MRVDGLAGEFDADSGTDDAASAVAAGEIARAQGLRSPVGMLQRSRDAIGILGEAEQFGAELDAAAKLLQSCAQDGERARLQQHPHAGIGNVRRRFALFDAVEFRRTDRLRTVPRQRRIVLAAGLVHLADDAEIVIHLQCARLDALAARTGAMVRRRGIGLDDAHGDAAARQIAGQNKAGRPAPAIRTSMSAKLALHPFRRQASV